MTNRKRSRPQGKAKLPEKSVRSPRPPAEKPQYYRLRVGRKMSDLTADWQWETLVERGPLGLCEQRGMAAANYGVFRLREDGSREWYRPRRIVIDPVDEEAKEADHAS